MAKQTINTGTVPSDGTGDGFRTAMTKVNGNFTEVYESLEEKAAANHDHIIDDTVGLQAALDAKAASSHTHAIGDTTGLQAALDAKAASSHTHAIGDTTGLQDALDAKEAALTAASQAEMEAGTESAARKMSPLGVAQAIAALGGGGGGGGGKVLQVIFASKTDTSTGSGTTWAATGLSVSITPSSTDSRVLIFAALSVVSSNTSAVALARISKGGSPLLQGDAASPRVQTQAAFTGYVATNMISSLNLMVQDMPASVEPQTYDVECAGVGASSWRMNYSISDAASAAVPRAASSIIAVEIGA